MRALDLLAALGSVELRQFLGLIVLLDVPRYLLVAIVAAIIPPSGRAAGPASASVSGLVACHNEENTIGTCVASMRAAGIEQIVVVDDGSTDLTQAVASTLDVTVIHLPERMGKPHAMNMGLPYCSGELVLATDADTTLEVDSIAKIIPFLEPGVAGVGFGLVARNADATLTSRYQAIEYAIEFAASRRIADALGILPNVSGAAGIFRRAALVEVGGWDYQVAEDAALAMKLRAAGWKLRYAPLAQAWTMVPETPVDLLMQRLRWDASIITIWLRKYRWFLNPFSPRFTPANLFTSLDVLVFGALLPLLLPLYMFWLWTLLGLDGLLLVLGAAMLALVAINSVIVFLVGVPLRLLIYVPLHVVLGVIMMRPLRVAALIGELAFDITRRDDYLPQSQRWRLK